MTARLLAIMGSGETAPTMVKVHRAVVTATGAQRPGLLLDTPFGFQLNADDLAARSVAYFERSVGASLDVAQARTAADLAGRSGEALSARLATAPFAFSGPGSPTYALRLWRGSPVPGLLRDKLFGGGAVVFSSAAALTLGPHTVPVYEIYKAGEPPRWEQGLDLLRAIDPRFAAAIVPHWDNAEGGTHDTRFCYLGEPRLARLEAALPDEAWVLGVDEHTALVLDLDAGTVTVQGLGTVTVRVDGRSEALPTGTITTLSSLLALAGELRRRVTAPGARAGGGPVAARPATGPAAGDPQPATGTTAGDPQPATGEDGAGRGCTPLARAARGHQEAAARARACGDIPGMVDALLALEDELWAWRTDPTQTDDQDRVRAVLRGMVAELGEVAAAGSRDPSAIVGPYVDLALRLRDRARATGHYAEADTVRDELIALGVEVRDTLQGTAWTVAPKSSG